MNCNKIPVAVAVGQKAYLSYNHFLAMNKELFAAIDMRCFYQYKRK
jgi:hypothetical protein